MLEISKLTKKKHRKDTQGFCNAGVFYCVTADETFCRPRPVYFQRLLSHVEVVFDTFSDLC